MTDSGPAAPRHLKGVPSTISYSQRCSHPDCPLDAWCAHCGGACLFHCVGQTTRWEALKYFWRAWRAYCANRL